MKIPAVHLETERLIIRTYKVTDGFDLFHLVKRNAEILRNYFPLTVEQNTSAMAKRQYILERNAERIAGRNLFAGIFLKENEALIGQLIIKEINWRVPKCEAGYFLDSAVYGKGYAAEALEAFLEFCFIELRMEKISLRIEPVNTASRKLASRCGFTFIGLAKNDFRSADGRLMDCEIWEKTS